MRAFVALEIDEACRAGIADASERLRAAPGAPKASWVKPENLHVTMKFLGDVDEDVARALGASLEELVAGAAPEHQTLRSGAVGAFPSLTRARIIVIPFDDPGGALARLAAALDARAATFGVAPETRPFTPHVTLARAKHPFDARHWLASIAAAPFACTPTHVTLYESTLTPEGPRYRPLSTARYA